MPVATQEPHVNVRRLRRRILPKPVHSDGPANGQTAFDEENARTTNSDVADFAEMPRNSTDSMNLSPNRDLYNNPLPRTPTPNVNFQRRSPLSPSSNVFTELRVTSPNAGPGPGGYDLRDTARRRSYQESFGSSTYPMQQSPRYNSGNPLEDTDRKSESPTRKRRRISHSIIDLTQSPSPPPVRPWQSTNHSGPQQRSLALSSRHGNSMLISGDRCTTPGRRSSGRRSPITRRQSQRFLDRQARRNSNQSPFNNDRRAFHPPNVPPRLSQQVPPLPQQQQQQPIVFEVDQMSAAPVSISFSLPHQTIPICSSQPIPQCNAQYHPHPSQVPHQQHQYPGMPPSCNTLPHPPPPHTTAIPVPMCQAGHIPACNVTHIPACSVAQAIPVSHPSMGPALIPQNAFYTGPPMAHPQHHPLQHPHPHPHHHHHHHHHHPHHRYHPSAPHHMQSTTHYLPPQQQQHRSPLHAVDNDVEIIGERALPIPLPPHPGPGFHHVPSPVPHHHTPPLTPSPPLHHMLQEPQVRPAPPDFPYMHNFQQHSYPRFGHITYPQRRISSRRWRPQPPAPQHPTPTPQSYPGLLLHYLAMLSNPPMVPPYGMEIDSEDGSETENYEALLNLAERLGEAKPRGLTKADIEQLPSYRYNPDTHQSVSDQTCCVICMCDFEQRQLLRVLPCSHEFHTKCVDKWLKTNRTCPICRADASELAGTQSD